jgi:Flp pilus assembly protein TadG
MIGWFRRNFRLFHRDRQGTAFLYVTVCLPVIFAMSAFSLDLGYMLYIKSRLQTAADLGALAGGKLLITDTTTFATNRAKDVTWKNLPPQWQSPGSTLKAQVDAIAGCKSAAPFSSSDCTYATSGNNAIRVTASVTAPMFFASFFGTKTTTLSASSVAGGGNTPPLNVVVIVDSTASMSDPCSTDQTKTKLECAKAAVKSMLSTLAPASAKVSLMTYPGLNKNKSDWINFVTCNPDGALTGPTYVLTGSGNNTKCSIAPTNVDGVQWYNKSPEYFIVKDSENYRLNPKAVPPGDLDTSSALVKAVGGGVGACDNTFKLLLKSGKAYTVKVTTTDACGQSITDTVYASNINSSPKDGNQTGLQSVGGAGTYFADVLSEAQTKLKADNDALAADKKRQNVIIILSDGDAGAKSNGFSTTKQCQKAIDNADAATAAGTWVYSIAYDASTSQPSAQTPSCSTDNSLTAAGPKMSACETMRQVASDATKFFSNTSTCNAGASNTNADLSAIFKSIAVSLMKTRRVSESLFPPS